MRRFRIMDVFAEARLAGNPLGVVLDCDGLSTEQMQAIAREMNYSETTFIEAHAARDGAWPVRIFTPVAELPFAGHPTLGTATVIRDELCEKPAGEIVLDLRVGRVPVSFPADPGPGSLAWMRPPTPELSPGCSREEAARALALDVDDLDPDFEPASAQVGISFLLVPLRDLDAVVRARPTAESAEALGELGVPRAPFVFARETAEPANDIHARMFAPADGTPEDPATGSANACLAAWLTEHDYVGVPPVRARVEQGYEMKRPSLLYLEGERQDGRTNVRVGGRVIECARGELIE